MPTTPQRGDFIRVRTRRWLVEDERSAGDGLTALRLASVDDDAQGEVVEVLCLVLPAVARTSILGKRLESPEWRIPEKSLDTQRRPEIGPKRTCRDLASSVLVPLPEDHDSLSEGSG